MARVHAGSGRTERAESHRETRRPAEVIVVDIVYLIFGFIAVILGLRFVLRLLGANPDAGFVQIVYGIAAPFMAPFEAVFPTVQAEGAVFEWSVLLAMVVYGLIAWGIASLIFAVTPRSSASTVEEVEHVDTTEESDRHASGHEHDSHSH